MGQLQCYSGQVWERKDDVCTPEYEQHRGHLILHQPLLTITYHHGTPPKNDPRLEKFHYIYPDCDQPACYVNFIQPFPFLNHIKYFDYYVQIKTHSSHTWELCQQLYME